MIYSFIFSLISIFILVRIFNSHLNVYFSKFISFFGPKAFPEVKNEFNKFALLRILFGIIILWRGFSNYGLFIPENINSPVGVWQIAEILAGLFITFGFFTQITFIFLILFMWQIGDAIIGKATLGNDIAAMLALFLLLVNSGRFLSLDSIALKNFPTLNIFLFYSKDFLSYREIFLSKFIALTAYWAVCVYSVTVHLSETSWLDGTAGPLLLSNNFMATFHEFTTFLFVNFPFLNYVAKVSLWMMMIWYPFVLPFVLMGGVLRKYIIIWGYLFFILSLGFIQLGYLAEIEFLLWFALFWSFLGINTIKHLNVYYDDRCNLCDKTIQIITFLDIFGIVHLKPLSKNSKDLEKKYNLTKNEYLNDLFGVDHEGNLYGGYNFYLKLTKKIVVLWIFYPILLIFKLLLIGPIIYKFVAKKRLEWFGVCDIQRKKYSLNFPFTRPINRNKDINIYHKTFTIHLLTLTVCYLTALFFQHNNQYISKLANAAHIYGITPINVFNAEDLKMAENWFTLYSYDTGENFLLNSDGSRMRTPVRLGMHKSDKIYFGGTLLIRRRAIENNSCFFEREFNSISYLSKVYLHKNNIYKQELNNYKFRFVQFHQPLPNHEALLKNKYIVGETSIICEHDFVVYKK